MDFDAVTLDYRGSIRLLIIFIVYWAVMFGSPSFNPWLILVIVIHQRDILII